MIGSLQEAKGEGADITISDRDPASLPVEDLTTVQEVEAAMNAPAVSKTRKQKLKQRLRALQVCITSNVCIPSELVRPEVISDQ